MSTNPIIQKPGYSEADRLVITHADDIGMCQASIQAYEDLFAFGTLKSGAVMAPCPWFPAAAAMQKRIPACDLGVHLVLTSKWDFYRWCPLTAGITGSSLVDDDGFFPRSDSEVQERGNPDKARAELLAQVQRALQFRINDAFVKILEEEDIGLIGYRKVREAMRQYPSSLGGENR